ncbi:hypothetical protein E2C01_063275 [Portunus trituberculatus]|uniref:Uncharacterized protein n=1 Tax=Portunus trituberculatus TaxID=210409 RepID=A0A5B7H8R5_PORTR|nr:hypothetical protein [Portunus trituberculatus]
MNYTVIPPSLTTVSVFTDLSLLRFLATTNFKTHTHTHTRDTVPTRCLRATRREKLQQELEPDLDMCTRGEGAISFGSYRPKKKKKKERWNRVVLKTYDRIKTYAVL